MSKKCIVKDLNVESSFNIILLILVRDQEISWQHPV